jgi:hypothetical protein
MRTDMNEIIPPAIVKPADSLAELAARIRAEHDRVEAALTAGLEHAFKAGELLIEAKKRCRHGQWLPWLRDNVPFSERTAQAYARVVKRRKELEAKAQSLADLTFEEGLKLLASPAETETPPLWVGYWKQAGVGFPASTGREYREWLQAKSPNLFPDCGPEADAEFDALLYRALAKIGAAYLFVNDNDAQGRRLPSPGDLSPYGPPWEGPHAEQNRASAWELWTALELGRFLNVMDRAGCLRWGKWVTFHLPEEPFSNMEEAAKAKEAVRCLAEWGNEKPFTDEEAARLIGVDVAHLPEGLFSTIDGYAFSFLYPVMPEAVRKEFAALMPESAGRLAGAPPVRELPAQAGPDEDEWPFQAHRREQ